MVLIFKLFILIFFLISCSIPQSNADSSEQSKKENSVKNGFDAPSLEIYNFGRCNINSRSEPDKYLLANPDGSVTVRQINSYADYYQWEVFLVTADYFGKPYNRVLFKFNNFMLSNEDIPYYLGVGKHYDYDQLKYVANVNLQAFPISSSIRYPDYDYNLLWDLYSYPSFLIGGKMYNFISNIGAEVWKMITISFNYTELYTYNYTYLPSNHWNLQWESDSDS